MQRLLNKDRCLNEIAFEDLNFHNNTINCIERQVRASLEILKTSNTSLLKRLAIDACILQGMFFIVPTVIKVSKHYLIKVIQMMEKSVQKQTKRNGLESIILQTIIGRWKDCLKKFPI